MNKIADDHLLRFVERIERLEEERKGIADDIREVKAQAKAVGFDVKTINQCIKERAKDTAERQEQMTMFDLYWQALDRAEKGKANDAA